MVKRFDNSHHLFSLYIYGSYYFIFPWLRSKHAEYKDFFNLTNSVYIKKDTVRNNCMEDKTLSYHIFESLHPTFPSYCQIKLFILLSFFLFLKVSSLSLKQINFFGTNYGLPCKTT